MNELITYIKRFSPLEETALEEFVLAAKKKTYKKDDVILQKGETCRYIFFIQEGLVKSSLPGDEKEFIMRFFHENVMFSVFDSFVARQPSKYSLVALEPTTVITIRYDVMERMCQKHHSVETFYRKLVSVAVTKMMKRISEMLEDNASERYHEFVAENSAIIQRISLGDLSKYLGITQQSLSRIRAARE